MSKAVCIGAINWDAALPKESYFGGFTCRNLGVEEFKNRLPFFAKKSENGFDIPPRSQKDYDLELQYAIDAGLDFFAYCWYPDDNEPRNFGKTAPIYDYLDPHFHELNVSRKMYQHSELRHKIKMCAIIFNEHAYSVQDMENLCLAMNESYYLKIDGRPLVMIFAGYDAEFINNVRAFAKQRGLDPYIAFITRGLANPDVDYTAADATTAYASGHEAETFDELTTKTDNDNKNRLNYKLKTIPIMSLGWNPQPRIKRPCPWVSYKDTMYCAQPNIDELRRAFFSLYDFIDKNSKVADTDLALVFAWNEFEEGGYLCPTLGEDLKPNDRLIKDFASVKKEFESR